MVKRKPNENDIRDYDRTKDSLRMKKEELEIFKDKEKRLGRVKTRGPINRIINSIKDLQNKLNKLEKKTKSRKTTSPN